MNYQLFACLEYLIWEYLSTFYILSNQHSVEEFYENLFTAEEDLDYSSFSETLTAMELAEFCRLVASDWSGRCRKWCD